MTLNDLLTPERKSRVRRAGQAVVGTCLVTMIFCTGGMTGYWWRDNIAQKRRIEQRLDHLAEIKRLTEAYGRDVKTLGSDTREAANAVVEAAAAVEATNDKATEAATVANKAAAQSKVAVQQANRAAAAVNKIDQVPEPTRQQINRRVDDINKRVQK